MSSGPQDWTGRIRQVVLLVVVVAAGVRIAWALLVPAVPFLIALAVVLTVLGVALFGRRST